MAGDVNHVIHAAKDAIVAVRGKHRPVCGVIRPIVPILAVRVLVVLLVILIEEALGIAPDGLHDAGPGISNADVSCEVRARFNFVALFVPNHGIDSEHGRAGAAGLHGIESRFGGAEEAAGFRLPPGIDDDGFTFAHAFVIPLPDFGLDGLPDRSHVLEVVVVFLGFVGAGFAEHANGGRGGVENVDAEAFGDAPGAAHIRELWHAFVENARGGERERSVNNVGVPGDPADVGHAPVDVRGMNVLIVFRGAGHVGEITAGAVLAALGFAGRAAGIHEKERSFRILRNRLDGVAAIVLQNIVDKIVALHDHGRF